MNPNSMSIWLPVVEKVGVPSPRTLLVPVDAEVLGSWMDGPDELEPDRHERLVVLLEELRQHASAFGFPLFLRTDLASGKHSWQSSCCCPDADSFLSHLYEVIQFNELAGLTGLDYSAIAFRELLPLESAFTAFDGLPIARERRFFVEAGEGVVCHHPYWVEDAVEEGDPAAADRSIFYSDDIYQVELEPDWRQLLAELNDERRDPPYLGHWASAVVDLLGGSWSVDFARAVDGRWYLIDMALAAESWHPEHVL
jgi:hypothetical protein